MDESISRGYILLSRGTRADHVVHRNIDLGHLRPPEDKCHCIYIALLLAGVGFLLPYNSFIIAVDYFQGRYPETTIVFDMSLIYILIAFVAVIINNVLVESLSLKVRITFGYILAFFTLLFVATFEIWLELFDTSTGYRINLVAVAVVALGCTVQQSSFYGYTSMLPSRYTQAVMTGESAAGLITSINRILTKLLLHDERFNTIFFFCISIAIVCFCFAIFFFLQKTEFVQFYTAICSNQNESDEMHKKIMLEPTEDLGLVDILDPVESKTGKYGVLSLRTPSATPPGEAHTSGDRFDCNQETEDGFWRLSSETDSIRSGPSHDGKTYRVEEVVVRMRGTTYTKHIQMWSGIKRGVIARWHVTRSVWPYMLSIAMAYFVTLCLFPGIESEIVNCDLGSWMPVAMMAIFNLFDFIGKIVASIRYDWTRSQLLLFTSLRIILVPLMAMCAAPRGQPLIPNPGWALVFSLLLGISNGVFGSIPMILAPSRVSDDLKELTGNTMTLSYSIGLTTGSAVAYLIDFLLGPPLSDPCSTSSQTAIPELYNITTASSDIVNISTLIPSTTITDWNVTLTSTFQVYTQNSSLL